MNPSRFLKQDDLSYLVQVLTTHALDMNTADARRDLLINAGLARDFCSRLTFDMSASQFVNTLVAHFREYTITEKQPMYHPLVSLLTYLLATASLEDEERRLFQQLVDLGCDNMRALLACRAVGRIESPAGSAIGTGILIDRQHVLTCEHVLTHRHEKEKQQTIIRFGYKMGTYGLSRGSICELDMNTIVSHDSESDYAVLQVIGQAPLTAIPLLAGYPQSQQNVCLIHHPLGGPIEISDSGHIVSSNAHYVYHTIQTQYGSSGGAIVDTNWHLIAIHRGVPQANPPIDTAVSEGVPLYSFWDRVKPFLTFT